MNSVEQLLFRNPTLGKILPIMVGATAIISMISPILLPLTPLPVLFIGTYYGRRELIILSILSAVVCYLLIPQPALFWVVGYGLGLSWLLSELFRLNISFTTVIITSAIASILVPLIVLSAIYLKNPLTSVQEIITGEIRGIVTLIKEHPEKYPQLSNNEPVWDAITKYPDTLLQNIFRVLPGLYGAFIILLSTSALIIFRKTSSLINVKAPISMNEWSTPTWFVWLLVGSIVMAIWGTSTLEILGITLSILTLTMYFVHGMAIISYWFSVRKSSSWARLFFYVILIVLFYPIAVAVAAVGIVDHLAHFRSRIKPPTEFERGEMS